MLLINDFIRFSLFHFKLIGFHPANSKPWNFLRLIYMNIMTVFFTLLFPFLAILQLFFIRNSVDFLSTINLTLPLIVCAIKRICFFGKYHLILNINALLDEIEAKLSRYEETVIELKRIKRTVNLFFRNITFIGYSTLIILCLAPHFQSKRELIFNVWYPEWIDWRNDQIAYIFVLIYQTIATFSCGMMDILVEPVYATYMLLCSRYLSVLKTLLVDLDKNNSENNCKENYLKFLLILDVYEQVER